MKPQGEQKKLSFANAIGGPLVFTFYKILNIEKAQLSEVIQSCGGKVVEYNDRDEFTIVLTKKNKHSSEEIQFDAKYIKDCQEKNEILPLERYRLDKKVEFGCYFSKPLGSKTCIFSKHIQQGKCEKHNVSTDENANSESDNEADLEKKLEYLKGIIYVEKGPEVKIERTDFSEDEVEKMQESQSLESETYYEESQSLLRKKVK